MCTPIYLSAPPRIFWLRSHTLSWITCSLQSGCIMGYAQMPKFGSANWDKIEPLGFERLLTPALEDPDACCCCIQCIHFVHPDLYYFCYCQISHVKELASGSAGMSLNDESGNVSWKVQNFRNCRLFSTFSLVKRHWTASASSPIFFPKKLIFIPLEVMVGYKMVMFQIPYGTPLYDAVKSPEHFDIFFFFIEIGQKISWCCPKN